MVLLILCNGNLSKSSIFNPERATDTVVTDNYVLILQLPDGPAVYTHIRCTVREKRELKAIKSNNKLFDFQAL